MKLVLVWAVAVGGVGYAVWLLTPPRDVIGSRLPGFHGDGRRPRWVIKLEEEQDYELFHKTGGDSC